MDTHLNPHPGTTPSRQTLVIVVAVLGSILLAMLTYIQPGAPLIPGLDSSWAYGLNYTFQHDLVMGRDIIFTFGPLGFLEHTRALTDNMLAASSWFWFGCSITANFLLLCLARHMATTRWQLAINVGLAIALVVLLNDEAQRLLVILYAGVFLHWRSNNPLVLVLMALAATLAMLIKFSYGAIALSLLLPYFVLLLLRDRRWQQPLAGIVCIPLMLAAAWFCLYGEIGSIGTYFKGGMEFSRGSTSGMAVNPSNHWPGIIFFQIAALTGFWQAGKDFRRGPVWMTLCFIGPLFVWTKYAFGREDSAHLGSLMAFLFYFGLVATIAANSLSQKASCLLMIVLAFVTWRDMHTPATGKPIFTPDSAFLTVRPWSAPGVQPSLKENFDARSKETLEPLLMPQELREIVGNRSVDIYPWESLVAAANDLNWVPRPIYQNYITYTPYLDDKNREFFNSPRAPEFIVWHHHSFADIDIRYPYSTDPQTLAAILQHYRLVRCAQPFCVWQRTRNDLLTIRDIPQTAHAKWDEWINIPDLPADVVRLHVDAERTLAGKLNLAAWKEGGIQIDYRLRNGELRTHDVVIDNATSGLWVSPYLQTLAPANRPQPVSRDLLQTLLAAPPAKGFIEGREFNADGLKVWGWGLAPYLNTGTQQLAIVLFNEQHAYSVTLKNRPRPGITDFYVSQGAVDKAFADAQPPIEHPYSRLFFKYLDYCGFAESFSYHDMAEGEYQVRFVVINQGQIAVSEPQAPVTLGHADYLHNVEAVRLRTTRSWAFAPDFTIHWSGLEFSGERPW